MEQQTETTEERDEEISEKTEEIEGILSCV